MNSTDDTNSKIKQIKEYLFEIENELLFEIKGRLVKQDQEDYEENIQSIKIPKLIENIKETIQILLEKRIDDFKSILTNKQIIVNKPSLREYEPQLRQYEDNVRRQYKREIKAKINKGIAKHRLECYEAMEDEFEDMKDKLKYEDGQFLNNDRKDNEILILRAENANLKEVAQRNFNKKKESNALIAKNKDTESRLKSKIDKLTKKIEGLEKNQIHIDSKSNSSINININNGNAAAKWIIKKEEENQILSFNTSTMNKKIKEGGAETDRFNERNINILDPLEAKLIDIHNKAKAKSIRQDKSAFVDTNAILNKYNCYLNDFEDKSNNLSQGKTTLHKNNSNVFEETMKKEKISFNPSSGRLSSSLSAKPKQQPNNNSNYVKIANLLPLASKIPSSSRMQNQKFTNTLNKMYFLNNSVSKSSNKSSLSLRSNSKLNQNHNSQNKI